MFINENINVSDSAIFMGFMRHALIESLKENNADNESIKYIEESASDAQVLSLAMYGKSCPNDNPVFGESYLMSNLKDYMIENVNDFDFTDEYSCADFMNEIGGLSLIDSDSISIITEFSNLQEKDWKKFGNDLAGAAKMTYNQGKNYVKDKYNRVKTAHNAQQTGPGVGVTNKARDAAKNEITRRELKHRSKVSDAAEASGPGIENEKAATNARHASVNQLAKQDLADRMKIRDAAGDGPGAGVTANARAAGRNALIKNAVDDAEKRRITAAAKAAKAAKGSGKAAGGDTGVAAAKRGHAAAKDLADRKEAAALAQQTGPGIVDHKGNLDDTGGSGLMDKIRQAGDNIGTAWSTFTGFVNKYSGGHAKAIGVTALVGASAFLAYKAYKNYFSKAARACAGKSGAEKDACMARAKQGALGVKKANIKRAMSACSKTSNPAACRQKLQAKMS